MFCKTVFCTTTIPPSLTHTHLAEQTSLVMNEYHVVMPTIKLSNVLIFSLSLASHVNLNSNFSSFQYSSGLKGAVSRQSISFFLILPITASIAIKRKVSK